MRLIVGTLSRGSGTTNGNAAAKRRQLEGGFPALELEATTSAIPANQYTFQQYSIIIQLFNLLLLPNKFSMFIYYSFISHLFLIYSFFFYSPLNFLCSFISHLFYLLLSFILSIIYLLFTFYYSLINFLCSSIIHLFYNSK